MTDDELRALVRDAVQRHIGGRVSSPPSLAPPFPFSLIRARSADAGWPRDASIRMSSGPGLR